MRLRCAALVACSAIAVFGQKEMAPPSFDAVSVKPVAVGQLGSGPLRGGPGTGSPGRLTGVATLKELLKRALSVQEFQIVAPAWISTDRFELDARFPDDTNSTQFSAMLMSLLRERFGFAAHRETRDVPHVAILLARDGPQFKESPHADSSAEGLSAVSDEGSDASSTVKGADGLPDFPGGVVLRRSYMAAVSGADAVVYRLWARRETMGQLAARLSGQLDRPVIDMTGLKGEYDFSLTWTIETIGGHIPRTSPPPDEIETGGTPLTSDVPTLAIALQKQLGLRLERRRGAIEVLVVDTIMKIPVAN